LLYCNLFRQVYTNIFADGTTIFVPIGIPVWSVSGPLPTLAATDAGKAAQDMLYGGTFVGTVQYPLVSAGGGLSSAGGYLVTVNLFGREGVDIQNFKSGTSASVNSPLSHKSAGMEGYLQYNSINLAPGSKTLFAGAVFVGGSYGYSYSSNAFARDYGFGNSLSSGLGQISAGILINNVAKIVFSRAFGPSQTYIDSTTMARKTVNNLGAWSFGITYQSNPSAPASK